MKKIIYFCFILFSFMIFSYKVLASNKIVVTDYGVRFRSDATTNSSIITEFNYGDELELIDKNGPSGNGCGSNWYKGQYGSNIGYICSDYVTIKEEEIINVNDYKDYQDYLKKLGFPDSYIPYLVSLHAKHPKWQFKILNVNTDFNQLVNLEYDGYSKGWSLIEDTGRYYDGYKSFDNWSYNYFTDVFNNNFSGGGSNWYAASKKTIAYYMDPRNFFDEKRIFMFETLSYNSNYHTKSGVEAMLSGTFMSNKVADNDTGKTYADAFIDAGISYNVSPYVLVSRVIQEVGAYGSTIVSGEFPGYYGYYNFYNIGAYGNSANDTITNGLIYAKNQGWNTAYKAVVGGASFLADGYINGGQDTLYLQKWDLVGPNYVNHQYMQNIQAPYYESLKTYNGYNNIGLVDNEFVFSIPVILNMPDKTSLPNNGNPNNYLSSLSVNGNYLFNGVSNETVFNLNLDSTTKSIDIAASKVNYNATISGTGSVAINKDTTVIPIDVRAQNGDVRTYKINVTINNVEEALDISEILRVLNIKNDGKYIYGYNEKYDYNTLINNIKNKESKATVEYLNKDGSKKNGDIASGDRIIIKTSREEKEYKIVLYGDVNGDGKIGSADYIAIKNHIMNAKKLDEFELIYGDANKDSKISSADYIAIKNHIMNVKKIEQ